MPLINFISVDDREYGSRCGRRLQPTDSSDARCQRSSGPTSSSQCEAAFPIAQENRIVAFSPTSAATGLSAIGDFIFRVTLTSDAHIPNGVRVTQEKLGYKRVALIYDELHAIALSGANAFRKALTENGVEIVATETFQTGETDFSVQLTRIKGSKSRGYLYSGIAARYARDYDSSAGPWNPLCRTIYRAGTEHRRCAGGGVGC